MRFQDETQIKFIEVFPWNPNFETGISEIDEQHKQLVQLVNLLAGHIAFRSDTFTLNTIYNQLTHYAAYHFKTEEEIWFKIIGQDDWSLEHSKEHESFVFEIKKIKENKKLKPESEMMEEVLSFLTHWLAFHILDSDKKMAKVVNEVKNGKSLSSAKQNAVQDMNGVFKVLIDTILKMYDNLSARTLELMREVKERRKIADKLKLTANAFNNTLDEICITDANLKIIEANPSFCNAKDFIEIDILGKKLSDLKTGLKEKLDSIEYWENFKEIGHWSGVIQNRQDSGEMEGEWLTLSAMRNDAGEITNFVAVFSNVSHLIDQQNSLERSSSR